LRCPAYLARGGEPQRLADLASHARLHCSNVSLWEEWALIGLEEPETVVVAAPLRANNGDLLHQAAIAGLGIVHMPELLLGDDVAAGPLRPIRAGYGAAPMACSAL